MNEGFGDTLGAKMVQDGAKMAQDGAKMGQDGAKMGQDGHLTRLRKLAAILANSRHGMVDW